MIWILLIIVLILIFGLGAVFEAALWLLLILAVIALLGVLGVGRLLGR